MLFVGASKVIECRKHDAPVPAVIPPQCAIEREDKQEDEDSKHSVAAVGFLLCLRHGQAHQRTVRQKQQAHRHALDLKPQQADLHDLLQHLPVRCQVAGVRLAQALHDIVCNGTSVKCILWGKLLRLHFITSLGTMILR